MLLLVMYGAMAAPGPWGAAAHAQTDEIQVYDARINDPGQFSLTLHNNFTPNGRKESDSPGGIAPHNTLNGVPELAYGVKDWLEIGAYFPIYSVTDDGSALFDGMKLRALFVTPRAQERKFFYGVNFELSYNTRHWDPNRITGEIRTIIGCRLGPVDIIINPIFDTAFDGFNQISFAPAERVAYNLSDLWAVAVEHYANYGSFNDLLQRNRQYPELFAVIDYKGGPYPVEFGIGHGLNSASDDLVLKLMVTRNF